MYFYFIHRTLNADGIKFETVDTGLSATERVVEMWYEDDDDHINDDNNDHDDRNDDIDDDNF